MINQHKSIVLKGPKGCGKSFATAVLFLKLLENKQKCLYIGQRTLGSSLSESYFQNFLSDCGCVFDSTSRAKLQKLLSVDFRVGVVSLIRSFVEKEDYRLWPISHHEKNTTGFLMHVISLSGGSRLTKIITLSSGAFVTLHNNMDGDHSCIIVNLLSNSELQLHRTGGNKIPTNKNENKGLDF